MKHDIQLRLVSIAFRGSLNFLLFFQCVATPCFSFEKVEFNLRFILNFEYNATMFSNMWVALKGE